jgi:hypothetical protein
MDTNKVDVIKADIKKALKTVETKHKVLVNVGRITYSDNDMKFRMTVAESDGKTDNFLAAEFLSKCHKYGLEPESLGRLIRINGSVHKIICLKVKNRKYPIITERQDNKKQYKLTQWQVEEAIKKQDGRV